MAIYAVSDLHGQYKTFLEGLRQIEFTDADFLYVIGDAIDRGPNSVELLTHVMNAKNMDLILGNHEFMMLNSVSLDGEAFCNGDDWDLWLYSNGGNMTYEKYKNLTLDERKRLLAWLRGRCLMKIVECPRGGTKFCLTHSNYVPWYENVAYKDMDYETASNIVWNSIFRKDETKINDSVYRDHKQYVFVTGHVPVQRAFNMRDLTSVMQNGIQSITYKENLINIDGGCAMGKQYLDCENGAIFLRLNDRKVFTVPII